MKHILYTHYDMDGVGGDILFRLYHTGEDVIVLHGDYNEINMRLSGMLKQKNITPENAEITFSDIVPERGLIDQLFTRGFKVNVFDHHQTATWVKDVIPTAVIDPAGYHSGTSLLHEYLLTQPNAKMVKSKVVSEFVNNVRAWDTWEWKATNNLDAKRLVTLFWMLGYNYFLALYLKRFSDLENRDKFPVILDSHQLFIDARLANQQDVIDTVTPDKVYTTDIDGHKAAVVFTGFGFNFSDGSNQFLTKYTDYDIMVNINMAMKTISYRTIKDDIDLSALASRLGGGGHLKAAGSPVNPKCIERVIEDIFYDVKGG